jgi:hypothetical protein
MRASPSPQARTIESDDNSIEKQSQLCPSLILACQAMEIGELRILLVA